MKKLLIVVDFQNDFINGSLGFKDAESLIKPIKNEIEKYLKRNDDIIYTLDTHQKDYLSTLEGKYLPIEHCIENEDGWKIQKDCDYLDKAIKTFKKNTFPSLELANFLKDKEYEDIQLCGLVSNICVLSNAIMVKSALPNTKIFIQKNLTASNDKNLENECFDVLKGLHIEIK